MSDGPGAVDRLVFANVCDTYATRLFDYCAGVLRNPAAAANAVQDTLIAADTQIGKLRDYERLPVWLYAIARRQCMSQLASRSEPATAGESSAEYDFGEEYFDGAGFDGAGFDGAGFDDARFDDAGFDGAGPQIADDAADGPDRETLLVVRTALDGLSDRDREVLNLAFRHGVDDAGIAATLGVSTGRARALVSSASTRFEKSAAVVAMLARGWARCPVLEDIAGDWDPASPRLTPNLLDRFTRHIGSCGNCSQSRGYMVLRPDLLGAVPLAAPPAGLRFRITSMAADAEADSYRRRVTRRIGSLDKDGFPAQPARRRSVMVVMAASSAALVVLVVGGALLYKVTFGSPVGLSAASATATGTSGTAPGSSSPNSAAHGRRSATGRHVLSPFPVLFGPSPAPAGVPPVPLPQPSGHSPSPKPTHSTSPSPSPSPTKHSPTPTPTPTPTSPSPTPTSPSPTPTSPSPTPTTPTPQP